MTFHVRRSLSVLAAVFCLLSVWSVGNGASLWPLFAITAFSSALVLGTLLNRPMPLPLTPARRQKVTP